MMQMRKLGNSGLEIAPLMFGGNVFGWTATRPCRSAVAGSWGRSNASARRVYSKWCLTKGCESETVVAC